MTVADLVLILVLLASLVTVFRLVYLLARGR